MKVKVSRLFRIAVAAGILGSILQTYQFYIREPYGPLPIPWGVIGYFGLGGLFLLAWAITPSSWWDI